jgi:hypothetical protein
VGAVLLAALVAGVYLAWVWVPVYATHYEVKRVVREVGYRAAKDRDDGQLVEALASRLRALDAVPAPAADARARRALIDLQPQDITWERVPPASLHIAFEYERQVAYPIIDRTVDRVMTVDLVLDVSRPIWEASR